MGLMQRTVAVEGGRYRHKGTKAEVTATRWNKDGDHPAVRRYPIEGREFKGLLEVSPKERYNLRFGDWVVEDGPSMYAVEAAKFAQDFEEIAA
jgi:hypothetical protein